VAEARKRLPKVVSSEGVEAEGLRWIEQLKIDSHRAEMTLFEAARALAAADDRLEVSLNDLQIVAPLALRQRQTDFATKYFAAQQEEDGRIEAVIRGSKKRTSKRTGAKEENLSRNGRVEASETIPKQATLTKKEPKTG